MKLSNYTPGFVVSVDAARRLYRVSIPGVTDGAEVLPLAMVSYPIGDKSEHTEIRILPGDRVWLDFVNGDPRFPIITGFRPKETDNAMEWRRWHHDNIELQADDDMRLLATAGNLLAQAGVNVTVLAGGQVLVEAPTIVLRGTITLDGPTTVTGLLTWLASQVGTGGSTINGKNVGSTHTHGGVDTGGGTSGPPT